MAKENENRLNKKNINQELTCVVFKAGHEFVESPSNLSSLYRNKMANFILEDKTA